VQIVAYAPERLEALTPSLREMSGPRGDRFYRWRLGGPPSATTWLAMLGDTCGAMLSSMRKQYVIGGMQTDCYEIYNWSSAERFRGKGLGIMLLKRLMAEGVPIVNIGGSEDTLRLLPRLGWDTISHSRVLALPLSGRFIQRRLKDRSPTAAILGRIAFEALGRAWYHAHRPHPPKGWRAVPVTGFDSRLSELYLRRRSHALASIPDPAILDWATNGLSRSGLFLRFHFFQGSTLAGWGMARILTTVDGGRSSEIVDAYAAEPDVEVYRWVIAEMVSASAGLGADSVVTSATCPIMCAALRAERFVAAHSNVVRAWWPGKRPFPTGPIHLMRGSADHFLLPLPSEAELEHGA